MSKKRENPRNELKYYGLHACLMLWEKRPQDIIRVYLDPSNVKICKALLKYCAENKKAYHIISAEELAKVSDSVHHEGICILARELAVIEEKVFLSSLQSLHEKICLLYFDGVQNPHNIGSIIRSCAHFGVPYIMGKTGGLPNLSPSACRIAKGGAEMVRLVAFHDPLQALQLLKKKGFSLLATSSHAKHSLYEFSFPKRCILLIGAESTGVSKSLLSLSSTTLQIPGSGVVESLNVSVATSLCIGEYYRQHMSVK